MNMQDATWGMYLNVRYFPYPKICFSYLKIRQAVHFESLRFHAHFVLLCSSGMHTQADLLICSKGHGHATWGMCLDVRYFPYPKIRFEYLKIRRI